MIVLMREEERTERFYILQSSTCPETRHEARERTIYERLYSMTFMKGTNAF